MPSRIVICPVTTVVGTDGVTRRTPSVDFIPDPGRPGRTYTFSAAISDGLPGQQNNRCLCIVAGADMSALDSDPEITTLFEAQDDQTIGNYHAWLSNTPSGLGWSQSRVDAVRNRVAAQGRPVSDLNAGIPLWRFVNRIAEKFQASFDIRQAKTTIRSLP